MNKIHKLKGDKSPLIKGSNVEQLNMSTQSAVDTLWRKVADIDFKLSQSDSTINALKTDLSEKLITKKLVVNGLTMVALGNAATYRDEITDALKLQQVGTGVALNNTENTVEFNTLANLSDYMFTNVQLNHDRDLTSNIYPHLHTFQTVSGNPNYLLQYRWQINGQQKVSGWTNLKCNTPAFTYVSGTINQIYYASGITPPSGTGLSDILQFRILRDNANTSTLFSGVDPVGVTVGITSFDVHFKMDTLGSRSEYSK